MTCGINEQAIVVVLVDLLRSRDGVVVDPMVHRVWIAWVYHIVRIHQPRTPNSEDSSAPVVAKHVFVSVDVFPIKLAEICPRALYGTVQD